LGRKVALGTLADPSGIAEADVGAAVDVGVAVDVAVAVDVEASEVAESRRPVLQPASTVVNTAASTTATTTKEPAGQAGRQRSTFERTPHPGLVECRMPATSFPSESGSTGLLVVPVRDEQRDRAGRPPEEAGC
jgi:hypothetical protein